MPSIEPTIHLPPEDGDGPFDEDATNEPIVPGDIPAAGTLDEMGQQGVESAPDEDPCALDPECTPVSKPRPI